MSGCHINPAVTAGLLAGRKVTDHEKSYIIYYHLQMGLIRAVLYVLAQTCGAFLGAGILWTFTLNEV